MFKPSEAAGRRARGVAGLALLLPLCVLAGVTTTSEPAARPVAPAERSAKAAGTYQMRCWQYGRLLFEENQISLPAEGSLYSLKMSGTDRKGQPMFVAETKNATCLIRHASDEHIWPARPR